MAAPERSAAFTQFLRLKSALMLAEITGTSDRDHALKAGCAQVLEILKTHELLKKCIFKALEGHGIFFSP